MSWLAGFLRSASSSFARTSLARATTEAGRPARCPDHLVKREMFRVLAPEDIQMGLTDSMAMTPAASVSGFYLAHPDASYFNVGRIGSDQVEDWAGRMALDQRDAERALAPLLG